MSRKHSIYGIVSILFSVPFYILMRLFYMTDRLDKFYQQNFIYAFPAIFLVLPAITIGFAIAALKQKGRNRLFAFLGALVSVPVLLISLFQSVTTVAYIGIFIFSR
jgi:ABC-type tungstate transport system substrate-binding protein